MRMAFFFVLWHFPHRVLATRTAVVPLLPLGRPGLRLVFFAIVVSLQITQSIAYPWGRPEGTDFGLRIERQDKSVISA